MFETENLKKINKLRKPKDNSISLIYIILFWCKLKIKSFNKIIKVKEYPNFVVSIILFSLKFNFKIFIKTSFDKSSNLIQLISLIDNEKSKCFNKIRKNKDNAN